MTDCIVCGTKDIASSEEDYGMVQQYTCTRCGKFKFRDEGATGKINQLSDIKKAALSRVIRLNQSNNRMFEINEDILKNLLPVTPYEQGNNLIEYVGKNQDTPGEYCIDFQDRNKAFAAYAYIGMPIAEHEKNLKFLCENLAEKKYLQSATLRGEKMNFPESKTSKIRLSFDGWQKYEEIRNASEDSNRGFMAMKFPKKGLTEELDIAYKTFKEEIKDNTKFILDNPCLEKEKAGSITNRIATEIRKSRFVVADLTHDNSGAYWEAGFAHGLGKPVFYTCKKGEETHFDTSQHTTIEWVPGEEKNAAERLRYAILNTIPENL